MPKRRPLTPEEREEATRSRERMHEWASTDKSGASDLIADTQNDLRSAGANVDDAWDAVEDGDEKTRREAAYYADAALDKAEEKLREARDIVESESKD
ncbi:MAG: hypothetical protein F6K19_36355 [Cyanothece sp. SIO1E1]|nr:hypothetical protein [Cyanothece sp. SIO1E1]